MPIELKCFIGHNLISLKNPSETSQTAQKLEIISKLFFPKKAIQKQVSWTLEGQVIPFWRCQKF